MQPLDVMLIQCAACSRFNRVPATRVGDTAKCAACKASLLPLLHPIAVGSGAELDELVGDSPLPVLVDFWAAWCGPCRMVAPELAKLASTHRGELVVAKLDTEALPDVAARFHVQSLPTMVLFRGGKESTRLSGAMSAGAIAAKLSI